MKKTLFATGLALSLVASAAVMLTGCSSGGSSAPASVSGASPNQAFTGHTLDVTLSGSDTSWDGTETVSFGDGITVNKITVASASALVANITVATTATEGPRDVTVTKGNDSEAYKMSFQILYPIDVQVGGQMAQGSIASLTIVNHDFDNLFDDTTMGDGLFTAISYPNIDIKAPTGTYVQISSVTPFRISAQLFINVNATAGMFDVDLKSGPAGSQVDIVKPGALNIAARTAMPLTASTTFSVGVPGDSQLYTFTPTAGHFVDLAVSTAGMDSPVVIVLDNAGDFMSQVGGGADVPLLATSADPLYVIVWDRGGTGMYEADVQVTDLAVTAVSGGEGNDASNKDVNGATAIATLPAIVKDASLTDATDVDCYSFTVAAGKVIHARTIPGDEQTDTAIQFYDTAKAAFGDPVDNDYHENATSDPVPSAGTYYVCISAGSYFDASQVNYDLVVSLE